MRNKLLLIFSLFLLFSYNLLGQVPPPPDFHENGPGPGAPDTPIDSYLFGLMIVAIVMGVLYMLKFNNKKALIK